VLMVSGLDVVGFGGSAAVLCWDVCIYLLEHGIYTYSCIYLEFPSIWSLLRVRRPRTSCAPPGASASQHEIQRWERTCAAGMPTDIGAGGGAGAE
jgi:hypothetical protein